MRKRFEIQVFNWYRHREAIFPNRNASKTLEGKTQFPVVNKSVMRAKKLRLTMDKMTDVISESELAKKHSVYVAE